MVVVTWSCIVDEGVFENICRDPATGHKIKFLLCEIVSISNARTPRNQRPGQDFPL